MEARLVVSVLTLLPIAGGVCAQPTSHNPATTAGSSETHCAAAGTVAKGRTPRGDFIVTSKGSDPSDSTICIRVIEGASAGNLAGVENRLIYGWYSLTTRVRPAESQQKIREGLGAVLSGARTEAIFDATASLPGTARMWTNTETWTRTGQAILTIEGRAVNVITLHYTEKGGANSNVDDAWDLWYDPIRHMWLKGEMRSPGGPIKDTFEVTYVSPP